MQCQFCINEPKSWAGDSRKCYLEHGVHNWNCALVNKIRVIADNRYRETLNLPEVSYSIHYDQSQALIRIEDIEFPDDRTDALENEFVWDALWVGWYKSSGSTDSLILLSHRRPAQAADVYHLAFIYEHFKTKYPNIF